ncbi:hypothetical protein KC336_g5761 [Hortaea werneckii]|nr:hypothetical protein KC336_g5761 [Hortaea werneckii]
MEAHKHNPTRLNVFVLHQQLGDVPSREEFRAAHDNATATQCSGPGATDEYILLSAPERLSYPMDRSALVSVQSDIFISGYKRIADGISAERDKDASREIKASAGENAIKQGIEKLYDIYLSNLAISASQGMEALQRMIPAEDILTDSQRAQVLAESWTEFESIIAKNFFAKTNRHINVEAVAAGAGSKMIALRSTLRKRFVDVCQLAYALQNNPAAGSSSSWSLEATKAAMDQYLRSESSLLGDELPCPAELPLHPHAVQSTVHGNERLEEESPGDEEFSFDEQHFFSSGHPEHRSYTGSQASEASYDEEEDGAGADDEYAEGGGEDIQYSDGVETESEDDDGDVEMADFVVADEDISEEEEGEY